MNERRRSFGRSPASAGTARKFVVCWRWFWKAVRAPKRRSGTAWSGKRRLVGISGRLRGASFCAAMFDTLRKLLR